MITLQTCVGQGSPHQHRAQRNHVPVDLDQITCLLSLGWASGSPQSQAQPGFSLTLKYKYTWLGSPYVNVAWRSISPVLYLCWWQKVGKEQQLQRHPPALLHTAFYTSMTSQPVFSPSNGLNSLLKSVYTSCSHNILWHWAPQCVMKYCLMFGLST